MLAASTEGFTEELALSLGLRAELVYRQLRVFSPGPGF